MFKRISTEINVKLNSTKRRVKAKQAIADKT